MSAPATRGLRAHTWMRREPRKHCSTPNAPSGSSSAGSSSQPMPAIVSSCSRSSANCSRRPGGRSRRSMRSSAARAGHRRSAALPGQDRHRLGPAHARPAAGSALPLLDEAQALAGPGFDAERAQIHYLRGSLYFPLGQHGGCRAEQKRALEHARACRLNRAATAGAERAGGCTLRRGSHRVGLRALPRMRGDEPQAPLRADRGGQPADGRIRRTAHGAGSTRSTRRLRLLSPSTQRIGNAAARNRRASRMRNRVPGSGAKCKLARPHAQAAVEVSRAIGARRFEPGKLLLVAAMPTVTTAGARSGSDDARSARRAPASTSATAGR